MEDNQVEVKSKFSGIKRIYEDQYKKTDRWSVSKKCYCLRPTLSSHVLKTVQKPLKHTVNLNIMKLKYSKKMEMCQACFGKRIFRFSFRKKLDSCYNTEKP